MAGKFKIIAGILVGIWLTGAVVAGLVSEVGRKHDCVRDEGLIKGLLWCKTDTFDRDGGYTKMVTNNLRWPFLLMKNSNGIATSTHETSHALTSKEEFDKSAIGTMYKCYAVAVRANQMEEASVIGRTIGKLRRQDPALDSNHDQFMLYTSATIDRIEKEANGDFLLFYNHVCRESVSRMRQVLDDGML